MPPTQSAGGMRGWGSPSLSPRLAERSRRSCALLEAAGGASEAESTSQRAPWSCGTPLAQAWIWSWGAGYWQKGCPSPCRHPLGVKWHLPAVTRSLPPASSTVGFPEQRDPTRKPGAAERLRGDPRPRRGAAASVYSPHRALLSFGTTCGGSQVGAPLGPEGRERSP